MKGQCSPSELVSSRDTVTDTEVLQLTSHPSLQHATYFLQSSLTPDGRELLFTSYRTGAAQLFSVTDYPRGCVRQWTDGTPIHPFSPAIHPDGSRVFFVRGGEVWEIDRETLAERQIVSFDGAQLGEVSLGDQATWITAAAKIGTQPGLVCGRADGTEWKFLPFPRTVIHPQFHPTEPEWIEFAGDPAPRMHRIRRTGGNAECLYQHKNDEFVVHETFLGNTGDLVYTVWPHALWRMSWRTLQREKIADCNAWHITPNRAGNRVLFDTNHPDRGIHLIDVHTGVQTLVCLSQASSQGTQWKKSTYALAEDFDRARAAASTQGLSWMENSADTVYGPQYTHPHPSFSPDEQTVIFTSDRTGTPQVYAARIPGF